MRRAKEESEGEEEDRDREGREVLSRLDKGKKIDDAPPWALDDAHEIDVREMARLLQREERPAPLEEVERVADRGLFDDERFRLPRAAGPGTLQIVPLGPPGDSTIEDDIQRQYPVRVEEQMPEEMREYRWLEMVASAGDPMLLARALDPQLGAALEASPAKGDVERALRAGLLRARSRTAAEWTRLVVDAGGRFYCTESRDAERDRKRAAGERSAEGSEALEVSEPIQLVFYLGKSAFAYLALSPQDERERRTYAAHYYAPSRLRLQARATADAKQRAEGH